MSDWICLGQILKGLLSWKFSYDLQEAEISLRRNHYDQVQERLAHEEKRTMDLILPHRYKLRGEARVYPLAVEIRLPGSSA